MGRAYLPFLMEGLLLALTFMLQILGFTDMVTLHFNSKGWLYLRMTSAFILDRRRHGSDTPHARANEEISPAKAG